MKKLLSYMIEMKNCIRWYKAPKTKTLQIYDDSQADYLFFCKNFATIHTKKPSKKSDQTSNYFSLVESISNPIAHNLKNYLEERSISDRYTTHQNDLLPYKAIKKVMTCFYSPSMASFLNLSI